MIEQVSAAAANEAFGDSLLPRAAHVIALNERHLKRIMTEYIRYFHDDRTYLGLANRLRQAEQ